MYYAVTPDKAFLALMIIVAKNNTNKVASIALYGDKAETIHTMVLAKEYHPSDPEITLLEAILEDFKKPRVEHYTIALFPLIVLIAILLIILSYIVL